ncbi:hypothetical protein PCC7424_3499 [Gloeothece citriformis PCC 7424]|uniref:Uncharacterized protein n=1 Tax=Gloeothece citriformis (strain PCC 7424) TaxID=65393 RepID=B7KFH5_GLOC7|nr:hypothetical protein PCC7424_3499 [Gloeothece citriformis PCC 7424]
MMKGDYPLLISHYPLSKNRGKARLVSFPPVVYLNLI